MRLTHRQKIHHRGTEDTETHRGRVPARRRRSSSFIYWGGAYGTYFWHDPRERMYVIFMMQSQTARLPYRYLMRDLVNQALTGN